MQSAVRTLHAHGALMITASHNPLKDNGIKFMSAADEGHGALLSTARMAFLISEFSKIRSDKDTFLRLRDQLNGTAPTLPSSLTGYWLGRVLDGYLEDLKRLFPAPEGSPSSTLLTQIKDFPVVIDPNGGAGSARLLSRDTGILVWVLKQFGMQALEVNSDIGHPAHSLEPKEGSTGLQQMDEKLLELKQATGQARMFGVVFDWDADRGTTVPQTDPQTVTALNVAMSLSLMDAYHEADHQAVVPIASMPPLAAWTPSPNCFPGQSGRSVSDVLKRGKSIS